MNDKKYFCYEIFKNLSIWSRNGKLEYNPCSYYGGYYYQSESPNIEQAWNSAGRKKIIELVNKDLPIPGCRQCYANESNGIKSRRQSAIELYEKFHNDTNIDLSGPQGIDYSVGNLCNLKCIICGPYNSTQWIPDYQKLHPTENIDSFIYQKNNQLEISSDSALENVITVHFHGGGEPLLNNMHVNLLTHIKNANGLSNLRVFYNTNGTVTVTDKILKLWEQCKLVELYFSIDDIGIRYNYQRTGANFDVLNKHLRWYINNMPHNHMFNITTVWGYLNLYSLNELVDWHKNTFSSTRYGDPINLIFQEAIGATKISHISSGIRDILLEKFANYPTLLKLVNTLDVNNQSHEVFLKWIQKLDAIRGLTFNQTAPEWTKLLHDFV